MVDSMSVIANNRAGFDPFHSAGGVKITTSSRVEVRDSHVGYNNGPGIWTDVNSSAVTIVGNLVERNLRSGIEVELTTGATIAGNTALGNRESRYLGARIGERADLEQRGVRQPLADSGGGGAGDADVAGATLRNNVVGATGWQRRIAAHQ